MYHDIVEFRTGSQVLLLGHHPLLSQISRQDRNVSLKQNLKSLLTDPVSMRRLRSYLSTYGQVSVHLSDHDILERISHDIEGGAFFLVALPRATATQVHAGGLSRLSLPASSFSSSARNATPPGQWPLEQRVSEVIRRTATKIPASLQKLVLSLLSAENLAVIVGTFAFVAVANLTPYGWAADLTIVAMAYTFGGIAAIEALRDLAEGISKTVNARSNGDLDAGSVALARAIATLGVLGLIAVLHEFGKGKQGTVTAAGPLTTSVVEMRMATARNFFRQSGVAEKDIENYMKGIDFDQPVEVVPVEAGTRLSRLEVPGDLQGSWYGETSTTTPDQRGIASFGEAGIERQADGTPVIEMRAEDFHGAPPRRVLPEIKRKEEVGYVVNKTTQMLKSAVAGTPDKWSAPMRRGSVPTRGGAIQYFSRDKQNIR